MDGERRKAKDRVRERREREALKEWRKGQPRKGVTSKTLRNRRRGSDTDGKGEYLAGSETKDRGVEEDENEWKNERAMSALEEEGCYVADSERRGRGRMDAWKGSVR